MPRTKHLPFGQGEDPLRGLRGKGLVATGQAGDHVHAGDVRVAREEVVPHRKAEATGMMPRGRIHPGRQAFKQGNLIAFLAHHHVITRITNRVTVVPRQVQAFVCQRLAPRLVGKNHHIREQFRQVGQSVNVVEVRVRQQDALHGNVPAGQGRQTLQERRHVATIHQPHLRAPLMREDIRPGGKNRIDDIGDFHHERYISSPRILHLPAQHRARITWPQADEASLAGEYVSQL